MMINAYLESIPLLKDLWEGVILPALQAWKQHLGVVLAAVLVILYGRWRVLANEWPKLNLLRHLIHEGFATLAIILIFYYGTYVQHKIDSEALKEGLAHDSAQLNSRLVQKDQEELDESLNEAHGLIESAKGNQTGVLSALNQEVTLISIRTLALVRHTYPEVEPRSLSLFLSYPDKGRVINTVSVPAPESRHNFPMNGSLAGAAIAEKKVRYCPDVDQRFQDKDCQPFLESPSGSLDFNSIICIPVANSYDVIGSVCLDSKLKHAFDKMEFRNWLENLVDKESTVLISMLNGFRRSGAYITFKLSFQESGSEAKIRKIRQKVTAR